MNPPTPPNKEPTQIQHYEILDCIGRGGMGLVYVARDTRLERQVAIKYLRTELFEAHYRERFKREALLLAKLNHPNIVQIYDYIETPDQLALVMEYVDGKNLQMHLREHIAPLSLRATWLTQIAQGLAVAHDAGIIHRDLKFENILINQRNIAKITDLGIAKSQDITSTLTEHVTGSYCSMSPEQAKGDAIDFKSDLFSFGILAYQLLCGAHPFGDTSNKLQLMQRIISQPPTSPKNHNPNLPIDAIELLGQLLNKDPNKRPDNTHWVATQCEKLSQYFTDIASDIDQTQALSPAYHSSNTGMRDKSGLRTFEGTTFDTRFETSQANIAQKIQRYVKQKPAITALIVLSLVTITCVGIWHLTPKQARYIAVLPPILNSDGMQESQQALVKDAVYDAIQQSVLQLENYYLIPRNEIADINASNNKEGLEIVRRATAADELITAEIQCKSESCTITVSRLMPDGKTQESRLRIKDTKTVDVLTDNYLSVATIVQSNIGKLYAEKVSNLFEKIDEPEYEKFLAINHEYRDKGANQQFLETLDKLRTNTKKLPAVQTLYSEIALDLHYEKNDPTLLTNLEAMLEISPDQKNNITYYYNLFYLQIAQQKYLDADKTIETIQKFNASSSAISELYAYEMMSKKDYASAINFYKKALLAKNTTNNMYYLALAYWYESNNVLAKQYLKGSLSISPNLHKSQNLLGMISLIDGDLKTAMSSFEKLIELQNNDIISINNLGLCYLLDKQYQKSIELFTQANHLAPLKITYMLNKADANDLAGNKTEADAIYSDIINRLSSKEINSENLSFLSQANAHLGKHSAALNYLQQLEKIDSQSYKTTYTAALVHTLAKNNASAILNTEASLKKGMNSKWFGFSWFDQLCEGTEFTVLMQNFGEPNRCAPQNI